MKKILKNKYFPTVKDFYEAIYTFCGDFQKYDEEIKSLLGQKFQIIKAV